MMRKMSLALGVLFFLCGLTACFASAYYVFADWHALNVFYARFESLVKNNAPERSLFIASTEQAAFRLNCFADGVGVLLGAILAALDWLCLSIGGRNGRKLTTPRSQTRSRSSVFARNTLRNAELTRATRDWNGPGLNPTSCPQRWKWRPFKSCSI